MTGSPPGVEFHTFTVIGRCARTGRLGVGTATRSLAVGARVSHARAGLGAVSRRVFDAYRPAIPYYNLRQVDARVPPLPDWLREHRR
jgi:hypothetical protein